MEIKEWKNTLTIKKVFSKIYKNISTLSENILFQTGRWTNPIVFIGGSFIGGGRLGKKVISSSSMSKQGILKAEVIMKDEYIFNQVLRSGAVDGEFSLDFTLPPTKMSQITFCSTSYDQGAPVPNRITLFEVQIFINGEEVYSSKSIPWNYGVQYQTDGTSSKRLFRASYSTHEATMSCMFSFLYSEQKTARVLITQGAPHQGRPFMSAGVQLTASIMKDSSSNLENVVNIVAIEG